MVSETRPMVLAKGHNTRWPLTVCTAGGPGRAQGRRRRRPHPPGRPDHRPGLIEAELTAVIGAAPMNGPIPGWPGATAIALGCWPARLGELELRIPKLRAGSFFPSLLERRRRVDQALFAVVRRPTCTASPPARSTTWSAPWVPTAASPNQRSLGSAPTRPGGGRLPGPLPGRPELPLCGRRRHLRQGPGQPPGRRPSGGRATGVCGDGRREVLGFAVGDSEDGALWTAFLRSLKARGLTGVQLVIADAHLGLRQAVAASWPARPSSAAACTSCTTSWPGAQGLSRNGRGCDPDHRRSA
jgi:hypothetical protein